MPGLTGPPGLRWDLRLFVGQDINLLAIITVEGTTLNDILRGGFTEEDMAGAGCEWVVRESADYDSTLLTVTPVWDTGGRYFVTADKSLVTWTPGRYEHMFRTTGAGSTSPLIYGYVDFLAASAR